MTPLELLMCGAAVLVLPGPVPAAGRWRAVTGARPGRFGSAGEAPHFTAGRRAGGHRGGPLRLGVRALARVPVGPAPVGVAAGLTGAVVAGPVVGLAVGTAAATVAHLAGDRARARRRRRDVDAMLEAVTALTGELRAGSTPQSALRAAARAGAEAGGPGRPGRAADPLPGWVLHTAAATAELGGDVPAALGTAAGACHPELAAALRRLAAGWRVSECSGAPLCAVLDRVESDLRARRREVRQVEAHLSGPRATGATLAVLPLFGLLLGTAMGARPVTVLLHTGTGQLALLAGIVLDSLGALWTARLLRAGDP